MQEIECSWKNVLKVGKLVVFFTIFREQHTSKM